MIPKRLNELWKRSGYRSVTEIAKAGGWKGRSSIQRYFSAEEFKSEWLSLPVARQFVKAFKDRGKPPITEEEVLALAGPGAGTTARIVPLIELARADVWRPEEAGRWIAINRETGENAFAITILDDAMLPLYSRRDRHRRSRARSRTRPYRDRQNRWRSHSRLRAAQDREYEHENP
jgi:hypothetical protein